MARNPGTTKVVQALALINAASCASLLLLVWLANTSLVFDEHGHERAFVEDLFRILYLWVLATPLLAVVGLVLNGWARWKWGWFAHAGLLLLSAALVVLFSWGV